MTVATYLSYLLVAVPLTVWVATTLSRNGRVFLHDVFAGTTSSPTPSTGCWSSGSTCSTWAS